MQLNQCLPYLSFMNLMLYLLSTFVLTLAFPTPQDGLPIVQIMTTTSSSLKNTRLVVNQLTCLCIKSDLRSGPAFGIYGPPLRFVRSPAYILQ
jgi:hypothetical protein